MQIPKTQAFVGLPEVIPERTIQKIYLTNYCNVAFPDLQLIFDIKLETSIKANFIEVVMKDSDLEPKSEMRLKLRQNPKKELC